MEDPFLAFSCFQRCLLSLGCGPSCNFKEHHFNFSLPCHALTLPPLAPPFWSHWAHLDDKDIGRSLLSRLCRVPLARKQYIHRF